MITCYRGGRRLASFGYKCWRAQAPTVQLPPCFFPSPLSSCSSCPMAPPEKGKARRQGPDSPPPKRGRGRPRKHPLTPAATSRGRGGDLPHGDERLAGEGRCVVTARPPRPRFHSAEVLPEFVVWPVDPTGSWLNLPRSFADELLAGAPGGLWLQADDCCGKASSVSLRSPSSGTWL